MTFILDLFFQNLSIKIFYRNNLNQKINNIIKTNRSFLNSIEQFLPEEEYQLNDYGIQKRIYNQMDKKISDLPTYSDFIVFLITNVFSRVIAILLAGLSTQYIIDGIIKII